MQHFRENGMVHSMPTFFEENGAVQFYADSTDERSVYVNINGSQAIIPKARSMFSKHLSDAEYEELLRRRTVPEIAAILKNHPYFREGLATLSVHDPHRGQIEELLNTDIFTKYEKLIRYSQPGDLFSHYYLRESEMREILKALHLISIGYPGGYINQMATFMTQHASFDVFQLANARNFSQAVTTLRNTIYFRALKTQLDKDPLLRDFPSTEAAVLREYYAYLFEHIDKTFSGSERDSVKDLFLQEVEIYNLSLIRRVKSYFPKSYTPDEITALLVPYSYKLNRRKLDMLVNAPDFMALVGLFRTLGLDKYTGPVDIEELDATGDRVLYKHAENLLHMTSSPSAALAAFLTLAKLERDNMVSIIEGVRYKMPPERIRLLLRHTKN